MKRDRLQGRIFKTRLMAFFIVFAFVFVRYCYFGFEYFFQLDDYIQYHNLARDPGGAKAVINGLGLLAARPLAGLSDLTFWSGFYPHMMAAVAMISAMYACSACLFREVWSRHFGTGYVFLVVYALLPLGMEGTYWLSASSRVAVGLFFASLALYFFDRWCTEGRRRYLALFALPQLLAFGFYEQALIFSFASVIVLGALHWEKRSRALWGLLSFVNAAVYFVFTGIFHASVVYGDKLGLITSYNGFYWRKVFPDILGQLRKAFIGGGFYTIVKGAWRGVQIVFADLNIIYIAAVLLLCAVVFLLARKEIAAPKRTGTAVIVGLLLAAAPISVFFVVDNGWLSLRGTVMSFCGLALIIDALASEAAGRLRRGGTVTALIAAVLALIFCTASVSELSDYRGTTIKDREFVSLLETKLKTDGVFDSSLKIAVLGVEPSYLENQNYYYHEHIHGVTQSGWALTGALEWQAGRDRPEVTPMPMSPMYEPWNKDAMRLDGFDGVYVYLGGELVYVSAVKSGEDDYLLIGGHDEYLGRVWSENGYGYLELDGEADWNGAKK